MWVLITTAVDGSQTRMVFNTATEVLENMKPVIEAAQLWDMSRFTQWVHKAKIGQWIELRDNKNRCRCVIFRSVSVDDYRRKGGWHD